MKGEKDADIPKSPDFKRQLSSERATAYVESKKHLLQLREYAASMKLGRTTVESLNFEQREDFLTRELVAQISVGILSDELVNDIYKHRYRYSVYKSWWQHFKHDYMPSWFVKRYPVEKEQKSGYVTVKFTRYAEYPKANISLQQNKDFYEIHLGGFERVRDTIDVSD